MSIPVLTWRMSKALKGRLTVEHQWRGYLDLFDRDNAVATELRGLIRSESPNLYAILLRWERIRMLLLVEMRQIAGAYRVAVKLLETERSRVDDLRGNRAALAAAKDILRSADIGGFDRLSM